MILADGLRTAFRERAARLSGIDLAVYQKFAKDPHEPIIGLGDRDARIGFFGRDPGADEVKHGMPFIGAGGQKVRAGLYRHLYGSEMPDFAASVEVGNKFFWANTVPCKPLGNKAWPMKVKRDFCDLMIEVLLGYWRGREVITFGREAFFWFGIAGGKAVRESLEAFWLRDDRYTASVDVELASGSGQTRRFHLHPLPHPSPLNATWYKRFPELLENRLTQLDVSLRTLKVRRQVIGNG